jgi:hypothetical protein
MTKKDYNYIAAVEKAIAEKYGKTCVQDFRSSWEPDKEKEYLQQLAERNKEQQTKKRSTTKNLAPDVEIKQGREKNCSDRVCPVCKTYSFSSRDDLYMNRFGCCWRCHIDFVQGNEAEWLAGKRPDPEHVSQIVRRRV